MSKRLEVELPVCPKCHRIGRLPNTSNIMANYCIGPRGDTHAKAAMKPMKFREVQGPQKK